LQTGHYALVNVMQFSPDGKLLLTAVGDDTLKLWDVASGREVRTLPCEAHSLAVSPDGRRIVCASYGDTFTTVRDAQTGQEVAKLEGSNRLARVVAFSPDGKMIDRGSD
jgi:WD40 repeat protein